MSKARRRKALKNNLAFAAAVVVILSALFLLPKDRAQDIPDDEVHAGLGFDAQCLQCHSPGGLAPLSDEHPPKGKCLECHQI